MNSFTAGELTVRFGEADLTTCDREPIHIPGSIYPHGVLLVVDRESHRVEQIAGDTKFLLGIDPDRILGLPVSSVLESEANAFVTATAPCRRFRSFRRSYAWECAP